MGDHSGSFREYDFFRAMENEEIGDAKKYSQLEDSDFDCSQFLAVGEKFARDCFLSLCLPSAVAVGVLGVRVLHV